MPKLIGGAALAAGMLATGGSAALMSSDSRPAAPGGIVRVAGDKSSAAQPRRSVSATPQSASLSSTLAAPTLGLADSVIETFHDSEANQCGTQKVHIDGPVRAFEDQNNVIHLTVSDPNATGWQWTGSVTGFTNNPKTAALDCTPVMIGNSGNTDPSQFDQKTWIQAIHFAGSTVYAYGHQDYFGTRTNDPDCHDAGTSDGLPYCWYSSIPLWTATVSPPDRHVSFARSAATPGHVAIYPHVAYPGDANTTSPAGSDMARRRTSFAAAIRTERSTAITTCSRTAARTMPGRARACACSAAPIRPTGRAGGHGTAAPPRRNSPSR